MKSANLLPHDQCPQITEGKAYASPLIPSDTNTPIEVDGKEVYAYVSTPRHEQRKVYYPSVFTSLYEPFAGQVAQDLYSRESFDIRLRQRGRIIIKPADKLGALFTVPTSANKSKIYTIRDQKLTSETRTTDDVTNENILKKDDLSFDFTRNKIIESKEEKVVILAHPEPKAGLLAPYLNYFIGILSGQYILVDPYTHKMDDTKHSLESQAMPGGKSECTIINRPIYGTVRISTTDGRFYLQYTRNEGGALIGEVTRTRLMPYHEGAKDGEIEGCLQEGDALTAVYFSYYDPDGSGKPFTREEYIAYLEKKRKIVEERTTLPKVLNSLLGY